LTTRGLELNTSNFPTMEGVNANSKAYQEGVENLANVAPPRWLFPAASGWRNWGYSDSGFGRDRDGGRR
jgi:hypothetical protein